MNILHKGFNDFTTHRELLGSDAQDYVPFIGVPNSYSAIFYNPYNDHMLCYETIASVSTGGCKIVECFNINFLNAITTRVFNVDEKETVVISLKMNNSFTQEKRTKEAILQMIVQAKLYHLGIDDYEIEVWPHAIKLYLNADWKMAMLKFYFAESLEA